MSRSIILTGDGTPTVIDAATGATFHSIHGAVHESMHIFIGLGLNYALGRHGPCINILEIGWGSGLNTLLTFRHAPYKAEIYYEAIERAPIDLTLAEKLAGLYAKDNRELAIFTAMHREPGDRTVFPAPGFSFRKRLEDLAACTIENQFHLVYFDAFSPAVDPGLWTAGIFNKIYRQMLPGAFLVTFCSRGAVRRAMQASGLITEKLPGPPGKREIVRAMRPG